MNEDIEPLYNKIIEKKRKNLKNGKKPKDGCGKWKSYHNN